VKWLTAPCKGQKIIASFGKDTFGQPLFIPESTAWKAVGGNCKVKNCKAGWKDCPAQKK
jgi:hypothetical protein